MIEQVISREEISRVARRCWDARERCPYIPGTDAHDEWVRAYARLAAEELGRQARETRGLVRRGEGLR